jgi:hypothetical protein
VTDLSSAIIFSLQSGSKLNVRALNVPEDEDSLEGREYRKSLLFDIAKRPGNNVCADCGQDGTYSDGMRASVARAKG